MKRVSNKTFVVWFLIIFLVFSSASFVLAQMPGDTKEFAPSSSSSPISEAEIDKRVSRVEESMERTLDVFFAVFRPVFKHLVGYKEGKEGYGDLTIRVLLFLVVVLAVYGLLNETGIFAQRGWINFWIGVGIAALGIRILPTDFINSMLFPSGALVALIAIGLPFLLVFYILEKQNAVTRKIGWTIYLGLAILILLNNMTNRGVVSNPNSDTLLDMSFVAYIILAVVCGVMLWKDATIKSYFQRIRSQKQKEYTDDMARMRILQDLETVEKMMTKTKDPSKLKALEKEADRLKRVHDDI
jgi:hypothetical protein